MKPNVDYNTFYSTLFLLECLKYSTLKFKIPTTTETTKRTQSL